MAQAVSATYDLKLKVNETLGLSQDLAADPVIPHETDSVSGTLTASSAVPATKAWSDERSLTAGADSLDLTSLSRGSVLGAVDFTGLKVQLIKIVAASANTAAIVVADGASNGYQLFGDANGQVTLPAGAAVEFFGNEALANVSSTAKSIALSSTDLDATYQIILVAG